jgi:hypothetical protein
VKCGLSVFMKLLFSFPFAVLLCAVLLSGCASFETSRPGGDFVRSTDFSPLDTFRYKHTMISGMAFRQSSQEMVMRELSEKVLTEELSARGFEAEASSEDFYVVSKWRKEINMSAAEAVRFSLSVEIYDGATDTVFWRADLPSIFNAMQWSEERVSQTLRLAIENFPARIEKDPNLPNIE